LDDLKNVGESRYSPGDGTDQWVPILGVYVDDIHIYLRILILSQYHISPHVTSI